MTRRLDFEELSVIKLKVQFTDSVGVLVELKELDINVIDVNEIPNDLHVTLYEINKKSLVGDLVGNITVSLLMQDMISYKHRDVINSDGFSKENYRTYRLVDFCKIHFSFAFIVCFVFFFVPMSK